MELPDKVAIITGGGTGIGKATAILFASEGAKVLVTGRRQAPLRQVVDEITDTGGVAEAIVADVTDAGQVQSLFDKVIKKFGKIDILFNNAGKFIQGRESQDFSQDEWENIYRINFTGTMLCCKHVVPHLKTNGGGAIVNCTSVSGSVAQGMQAPYNVSKAAVEMLSKCMAIELAKYNIRVNTICPNLTETDMAAGLIEQHGGREKVAQWFPLKRIGKPIDMAYAALYMASDRASWITGNSFFIDGGSYLR